MGFDEQTGQTDRHAGTGQLGHLLATTAGGGAHGVTALQGVGHVEDDRVAAGALLHHAQPQHVHHQVVITEVDAALAQDQTVVAALLELVGDVLHLAWAQELRLLDVDDVAGAGHGLHQIGLARQEGGQLDDVDHLGHRFGLMGLVQIGDHRHAEGRFQLLEDLHPLFQTRTAVGVDGGAVGLVPARLEHERDTQLGGHFHVLLAHGHRHVARFQHVHATEQHERFVVGDVDAIDLDILLFHLRLP